MTVVIMSEDNTVFCETTVNSVLLKMLSSWWKTKLTLTGFKDAVQDSRCIVIHDTPRIAEMALNAAKLRLSQADLVASADLSLVFQLWRLADMWQFGHLSKLCQGAMQTLLTQTDPKTLTKFVTAAMEYNNTLLEEVLVPYFLNNPDLRSPSIYLAFDDRTLFKLAEVAPIAGFQTQSRRFRNRLMQYANTCSDEELLKYLLCNPEARSKQLHSSRSSECCMLLFAAAPLPLVGSMVRLALDPNNGWRAEEQQLAILAIDFDRVVSTDQSFLSSCQDDLPQQAYAYQSLWQASNRQMARPELCIASSAPWVVSFPNDFYGQEEELTAGPVKVVIRGTKTAIFFCSSSAYGILRSPSNCNRNMFCYEVVQAGVAFHAGKYQVLVVYEASNAVVLKQITSYDEGIIMHACVW